LENAHGICAGVRFCISIRRTKMAQRRLFLTEITFMHTGNAYMAKFSSIKIQQHLHDNMLQHPAQAGLQWHCGISCKVRSISVHDARVPRRQKGGDQRAGSFFPRMVDIKISDELISSIVGPRRAGTTT